ncbi:GNAT family N-acetyltransferase [Streptomyces blastmyceticus]|uniref:GNAT family N-acetyltransferase n=1 Tax=Streptomyces blastmyceticus TaxID=68180 RepID=A0ABN0WXM3_9ACTN
MNPLGRLPHPRTSDETPAPGAPDTFTVTRATLDDWHLVAEWAAAEGWNPGTGDLACFHPTDPAGFFVGRLGDRIVSAVSVVTYSPDYAFLGYYLVHPDHRGQGRGLATWRAAFPHAGTRTVGLDAVPAQQATYARAGFATAYTTIRYAGRPGGATAPATVAVVPATAAHLDAVAAYDRQCFPAERRAFLARWLTAPGHTACVHLDGGRVTGYGVIRPARDGRRIGPLFADTPEGAEALFDALTAQLGPHDEVLMDVPEPHRAAMALAASRGLTPSSHTVRMYTGPVPPTREDRVYGVTSLELG